MMRVFNHRCSRTVVYTAAGAGLLAAAVAGSWWLNGPAGGRPTVGQSHIAPVPVVVQSALPSHRVLGSLNSEHKLDVPPPLPSLAMALAVDSKLDYAWRQKVVQSLVAKLNPTQVDQLAAFLEEPRIPVGLTLEHVRSLKNDVLNVLGLQKEFQPALVRLLTRLSHDSTQDPVLRDYALQQLAGLDSVDYDAVAHWRLAQGDDPALAATALLHLLAFDREHPMPPVERSRLGDTAFVLASRAECPETSRATALQVCGQLKFTAARSLAYELARSSSVGFPLRIAAVATLGDLGGDIHTRDYLATLSTGPEKRLRLPADSALKRFSIN